MGRSPKRGLARAGKEILITVVGDPIKDLIFITSALGFLAVFFHLKSMTFRKQRSIRN